MPFQLLFSREAAAQLRDIENTDPKRARQVRKALAYLESNPRYPGLATHEYDSLTRILGVKVFEAYVQNQTPGAYRVFWYYAPQKGQISIYTITPQP